MYVIRTAFCWMNLLRREWIFLDFRHFFTGIHKEATPIGAERIFYSHVTSVTNPHFMRSIMEIRECGSLKLPTPNANFCSARCHCSQ